MLRECVYLQVAIYKDITFPSRMWMTSFRISAEKDIPTYKKNPYRMADTGKQKKMYYEHRHIIT